MSRVLHHIYLVHRYNRALSMVVYHLGCRQFIDEIIVCRRHLCKYLCVRVVCTLHILIEQCRPISLQDTHSFLYIYVVLQCRTPKFALLSLYVVQPIFRSLPHCRHGSKLCCVSFVTCFNLCPFAITADCWRTKGVAVLSWSFAVTARFHCLHETNAYLLLLI